MENNNPFPQWGDAKDRAKHYLCYYCLDLSPQNFSEDSYHELGEVIDLILDPLLERQAKLEEELEAMKEALMLLGLETDT